MFRSLGAGASSLAQSPSEDPAVVFFPTNQDSECMDGATGTRHWKLIKMDLTELCLYETQRALLVSFDYSFAFGTLQVYCLYLAKLLS